MAQVRDRAGFDATRTLDAVVMDTWPSSGLALHGFEIKVSRADWRRELAEPAKSAAFTRLLDYFWIVAPPDVVQRAELPELWGLLETTERGLVAKVQASRLRGTVSGGWRGQPGPEPMDRSFVARLLRAATARPPAPREGAKA